MLLTAINDFLHAPAHRPLPHLKMGNGHKKKSDKLVYKPIGLYSYER